MIAFKLQKLTIYSYEDGARRIPSTPRDRFEVMFNPSSLATSHQNVFEALQGLNTFGRPARYSYARSESMSVELVFDGSGVSDFAFMRPFGASKSVTSQVEAFLALTFRMHGEIHEPYYLRLMWGDAFAPFDCRLDQVDIKYTSFARSGAPLRAELSVTFIADVQEEKQQSAIGKESPDLSHVRVVRAGDTLPLLCQEVYGSPFYHLRVARYNHIDHPRDLKPGMTIVFPPLAGERR